MAERVTQKAKRKAKPARKSARAAGANGKRAGVGKVDVLERERDELKTQLADAVARISKLEVARDEAVNRIDWAIDSLHNLLESNA
ncbi:MAG: hypothetical protein WC829_20935 [Hyphomicrobium sp.]|jgi:hypothetical protein